MKVRQGFVSNSSTTSFSIYGVYLDLDDCNKIIKEKGLEEDGNEAIYCLGEYFEGKNNAIGVTYGEYDSLYLGAELSSMGDDETKRQFLDRIEVALNELLGEANVTGLGYHEEAWRDG